MNPLQRGGVYRSLLNRCHRPTLNVHKLQTRKVSKQVWDSFGFLKDGTDLNKRASSAWFFEAHPVGWRLIWAFCLMGPAHFLFWCHGVYDYILRRKNIPPFPVQYDAEYPWRPPAGVDNPLFAPAKKWEAIRQKKRKEVEENRFNRPFYFKEITKRPKWHKYREGGR